jgi:hypothetical protein
LPTIFLMPKINRHLVLGCLSLFAMWAAIPAQAAPLKVYFGTLHDHSSEGGDDGKGSVQDALKAARDQGYDFFALSPHNHMISDDTYRSLGQQMDEANKPGQFVTFRAMEWGVISKGGHIGIVSAAAVPRVTSTAWAQLWDAMEKDSGNPLVILNHPVWAKEFGGAPDATRDTRATLMEVLGGPSEYKGPAQQARCDFFHTDYCRALNQGWHLGVALGEDDHTGHWGQVSRSRMGVWAEELSREGLMKAFRSRSTFVTEDAHMTIRIEAGGVPMGGEAPFGPAELKYEVTHSGEKVPDVAVFMDKDGPGGDTAKEVARLHETAGTVSLKPEAPGACAFVVARDSSGDLVWSSPIWFGRSDKYLPPFGGHRGERAHVRNVPVDLNFAPVSALTAGLEIGRKVGGMIRDARHRGVVFYDVEDLKHLDGMTPEIFEKLAPGAVISGRAKTLEALMFALEQEDSLVVVGDRFDEFHYQQVRAETLLAHQLGALLDAGQAAEAQATVHLLLHLGPRAHDSIKNVMRAVNGLVKPDARPLVDKILKEID